MEQKNYLGHPHQISGVEEFRLVGGRGDGMRLLNVRNGKGLDFTISVDRCADITHLNFLGYNMSYFSPCGYVAPGYYDKGPFEFLKSFTCGFLTTCGLKTIGSPSIDNDIPYPLHGNISHIPAEHIFYTESADAIEIHARMNDSYLFNSKLTLERIITCSKANNVLSIFDVVTNDGTAPEPITLLYHINLGYPLLDEYTILDISSSKVIPRDQRAAKDISSWNQMLPPTAGFQEQCYYHEFSEKTAVIKAYNPTIKRGLTLQFPTDTLPLLTEWKMMGEKDYVLGLEPCSHKLDGRKALRENNELSFLAPGESKKFGFEVSFQDYFE